MNQADMEKINPDAIHAMANTARIKTWKAVDDIKALIEPGMTEQEAIKKANEYFASQGVRKFWHRTHIRFGTSTILSFDDPYEFNVVLKDSDIFYIDIGPVWDGIEGDCGDTFVIGNHEPYFEIKHDVKAIFDEARAYWRDVRPTGKELYKYAKDRVEKKGYLLHPSYVKGHRLSEFSHSNYTKEAAGNLDFPPSPERWVLEFQICDKSMKYGAFYEDLLD
jgi:Xaa-Pro aminopeptidase